MAYEIYKNRNSSGEEFHLMSDMYERVMREDKVLCTNAQKNLDRNVFTAGELHPKFEKAPLFFQSTVREVIREHFDREKVHGEIWPAKHKLPCKREVNDEDEKLCSSLECGGDALSW